MHNLNVTSQVLRKIDMAGCGLTAELINWRSVISKNILAISSPFSNLQLITEQLGASIWK
jgi:hypothetical protein